MCSRVLQTSKCEVRYEQRRTSIELCSRQQREFAPLVAAQTRSALIKTQLQHLMAGDVQWSQMLAALSSAAPHGVRVVGVHATITSGVAANAGSGTSGIAPGLSVLNQTGKVQIGSLTVNGTAPDKNAVAAYVDALTKLPGLTAPVPAVITTGDHGFDYVVNIIVTSDALGGRFLPSAPGAAQGGH